MVGPHAARAGPLEIFSAVSTVTPARPQGVTETARKNLGRHADIVAIKESTKNQLRYRRSVIKN